MNVACSCVVSDHAGTDASCSIGRIPPSKGADTSCLGMRISYSPYRAVAASKGGSGAVEHPAHRLLSAHDSLERPSVNLSQTQVPACARR